MLKQTILAVIAVFIAWSILDFLIHGVLLKSTYQETANLWRPEDEMNMPLMSIVTLVFSICFVIIYSYLIEPKSLSLGIKYGLILGIATGVSMGFGSYCYMPIPLSLAFSWFIGSLVEITLAGIIVGYMVKSLEEQKA
ncbi:MAG: hypothetical protein L3J75_13480 [Methylococcaceae bacterium]|nr:hypothetical protein [Methylococcaceae bacterium]